METYDEPIFPLFEEQLRCFRQGSPASQRPLPGSDEARLMSVGSGRQCSMWLEVFRPLGVFSKILMESSLWANSEEYCYVWNRLDTRFELSGFQLMPLGQSIEDTGCSLLPTPTIPNGGRVNPPETSLTGAHPDGRKRQIDLREAVKKLYATPQARDCHQGDAARVGRFGTKHGGRNLADEVMVPKLWPTPTERDWKSTSHGKADNARPLSEVAGLTGSGSLNPRFVEELMGYPIDYSALKR